MLRYPPMITLRSYPRLYQQVLLGISYLLTVLRFQKAGVVRDTVVRILTLKDQ
jgi:hypothetical protein